MTVSGWSSIAGPNDVQAIEVAARWADSTNAALSTPAGGAGRGAVRFDAVGKRFSEQSGLVLADVSLDVAPGTFTSILGPSGCGKSTLLSLVAGLERPTAGTVQVHGLPVDDVSGSLAFVFQDAALYPWRDALQNVAMPLEGKVPAEELKARAVEQLERVGLGACLHKRPHELSGGMRQRVMLARAFLTRPAILLLDEPFGALDALTREAMQTALATLWAADKPTVLFVTHAVDEAVFLSQRVVVMCGTPATVVHSRDIDEAYPRSPDLRFTHQFGDWCKELHSYLAPRPAL